MDRSKSLVPTPHGERTEINRPEDNAAFKWRETPLAKDVAGAPRELKMDFDAPKGGQQVVDPFARPVSEELGIEEVHADEYGEWEMTDADGKVIGHFSVGMGESLPDKIQDALQETARSVSPKGQGVYEATMTHGGTVRLKQMAH